MANSNTMSGIYYEMMRRCYNEKSVMYKNYGAIGITVCEEWHEREKFYQWCKENNYEKGMRIDRIDSTKGYSPDNCFLGYKNTIIRNSKSQKTKATAKERMEMKEKYGIIGKIVNDPLYGIYISMRTRCENQNHKHYKHYGGRGIKICEEWLGKYGFFSFRKWANENGRKEGLTLDRIDVNGNYEPSNCRWVTMQEQMNNRRNSVKIYISGVEYTVKQASEILDVSVEKLYSLNRQGKNEF